MSVAVIVQPVAIVTAANAKLWAPVFAADLDTRVTPLLAAAQSVIERDWRGRAFGVQTLELRRECFPMGGVLELPFPPLRSVASVKYTDAAGTEQTVAPTVYRAVGIGTDGLGSLVLASGATSWPVVPGGPEAVRVRFDAGYSDDDPTLLPVKHAIVLAASHLRSLSTQDLALRSSTTDGIGSTTWTVSPAAEELIRKTCDALLKRFEIPHA